MEAGAAVSIRDIGDALDGSNTGSSGNTVGNDLHRETVGNCRTVGSAAANIGSVRRRERL